MRVLLSVLSRWLKIVIVPRLVGRTTMNGKYVIKTIWNRGKAIKKSASQMPFSDGHFDPKTMSDIV